MRLHTLTIQAFGPFGGTETVDFDALSDAGLFLVHGPTGAGKTSVLDAVCFALYGRVPGVREDAKSPRSYHAPPDRVPEVRCEVTVRGRRLSIIRNPAWDRPKQRGTGYTRANAKVVVNELSEGRWHPITTRPDEAGQFIGDLLGLSLAQFCQMVLLPQGEFARFLRATAAERRTALERIFATGVFTDVENWLTEHSRALGRAAAEAEEQVGGIARLIAEHGRSAPPAVAADDDTASPDLDALAPWAAELAAVTAATAADLTALAGDSAAAHATARDRLEQARTAVERRQRLARARERESALELGAAARRAIDTELDAAVRAAGAVQPLRNAGYRRGKLEKARLTAAESLELAAGSGGPALRAAVPGEPSDPASGADAGPGDDTVRAALAEAERARRDETATLEHLRGDATRLAALRTEAATLATRVDRTEKRLAAARQTAAELPDRRSATAAELESARAATGSRTAAAESLDLARRRLDAAAAGVRLRTELAAGEQARTAAVDAAQSARELLLGLRERRIEGMAAELAAGLEPGTPCPVCGAAEHPAPADGHGDRPSPEDEEAAERAADTAAKRRGTAETAVTAIQGRLEAALATADGWDEATARERITERAAVLDGIDSAAARVERLTARLAEVDAELDSARTSESTLATELAEVSERLTAREQEAALLTEKLDRARGDDPGLDARIRRLRAEADLLAAAADAVRQRQEAAGELREAEREAERARNEAGFTDDDAVWAAERDNAARASLAHRAKEYDDERAAVRATLADPELLAAAQGPEPDLAALDAELAAAAAVEHDRRRRRDAFAERAARLADLRTELEHALRASGPARRRHAVASGLAALAAGTSGDNREKARLSAYVLAARLEQVVHAANHRLATMSGGRYLLRHTIDKAAGDRSRSGGGLGLRVLDAWTGQERDPATLSGGETFFSSLALALGLGDVAAQEAGGTDIGTLFVDEGFGTLDEDTLEEVLAILDELREGGRAVGVVSHVADLRTRIPAQLKATKTPTGSHLQQTT